MDCGSTFDLCTNNTANKVVTWACTNKAAMTAVSSELGAVGCKDIATTKYCLCDKEGCNSASNQSIVQMVTMIISSIFMKMAFA